MMINSIFEMLQICLDAIQHEETLVEDALARFPDQADELQPLLETADWLHKRAESHRPRPDFIETSRPRLVERIRLESASTAA